MSRVNEILYSLKNSSLDKYFLLLLGLLIIELLVGFSWPVRGRIEGEVDTELWLGPRESLLEKESVTNLRVDYLKGNLTNYPNKLSSALYWPNTNNTLFDTGLALSGDLETPLVQETSSNLDALNLKLDGYFAEDFGHDYPIGTAGGSSRVYFSEEKMNYWVTKGIVNYGGFSYRGVFLLEAIPTETMEEELGVSSNYGAGLQLALSGIKVSGVSVELKTRLGMVPNPQEMVKDKPGSGYDTFGADGRYTGYTGSEAEFNGIELGPVRFDTTSSFTAEGGFEKMEIDFSLEEKSEIFELDGVLTYKLDEKSLSLEPSVELEWACFDVYSAIRPTQLTGKENRITGINIKGFGINEIQLGNVRASFIQALGDNRLQRLKGQNDWRLRASDYHLTTEAEFSYEGRSFVFGGTDYEGVFSLEGGGGNLELAADFYWGTDPGLFGFTELTGEAKYRLNNSFELITGLILDPDEGFRNLVLNTIYRW